MEPERTPSVASVGRNALRRWHRWSPERVRSALSVVFGGVGREFGGVGGFGGFGGTGGFGGFGGFGDATEYPGNMLYSCKGTGASAIHGSEASHGDSTLVWLSMEMEDNARPVEQPAPKRTKTSSTRPDFTSDPWYTKLVPLFGVDSVAELNDTARFSQSDFARMASALKARSTQENVKAGSIKA